MKKISIIAITDKGIEQALILQKQFPKSLVITTRNTAHESVSVVSSISEYINSNFSKLDGICFISALGICVRTIICNGYNTYFFHLMLLFIQLNALRALKT